MLVEILDSKKKTIEELERKVNERKIQLTVRSEEG